MANLSPDLARATPALAEAELAARLTAQSPRRTPPPTPWVSTLIHAAVLVLWIALLGAPFGLHGVWVWSAGLVYVTYDTLLLVFTFWQTLPLLRTAPSPARDGRRVSVAVIVAARDEALVLPVTLQALLTQSDPPDRILIADDGSTDTTPQVLARLYGLGPPPLGGISTGHPQIHWLRLGGGRQGAGHEHRPVADRRGGGADGGRRYPAAARGHRRGAPRLLRRAGPGGHDRHPDTGLRAHAVRADHGVVPDLRVHQELPGPLRLDAAGQPAADLRRLRGLPAHRGAGGRRLRPRLPGGGLRADPPAEALQRAPRPPLDHPGARRGARPHRGAEHHPRLPPPAAALVRRLPPDPVLVPRHGGRPPLRRAGAWPCCR